MFMPRTLSAARACEDGKLPATGRLRADGAARTQLRKLRARSWAAVGSAPTTGADGGSEFPQLVFGEHGEQIRDRVVLSRLSCSSRSVRHCLARVAVRPRARAGERGRTVVSPYRRGVVGARSRPTSRVGGAGCGRPASDKPGWPRAPCRASLTVPGFPKGAFRTGMILRWGCLPSTP